MRTWVRASTRCVRSSSLVFCCGLLAACQLAAPAADEEAVPQKEVQTPPAGQRVLFSGNSACMPAEYLRDVAKAAGIEGHTIVRKQIRLLDEDWDAKRDGVGSILEQGRVDAVVLGFARWNIRTCFGAAEFALKHNPDFRVFGQALVLVGDGLGGAGPPDWRETYDNRRIPDLQAAMDKARKDFERKVEAANRRLGKRAIFIVPVGDALIKVRSMIVDGTFPGIERQSQLFPDWMPHPGGLMNVLAAYCVFSAMYGKSPVGLPNVLRINEEQNVILQKIAWETVSKYPYAGITPPPELGAPAEPGAAAAADKTGQPGGEAPPQAGIPAGWKDMGKGVPSDQVIKDYNDYIKKLPANERLGVADVRYYKDEKGRAGVAVTVVVSGTKWIHFLTYDRAGKRLGVKKTRVPGDRTGKAGGRGETWEPEMRTYHDRRSQVLVRQLTNYKGHSHHFYFTNPGWYDQGGKLVFASHRNGRANLFGIDLKTYRIGRLTDLTPGAEFMNACLNPRKDEAYFWDGLRLVSVDLKTRATRTMHELAKGWCVHMTNCSADGKSVYFCTWEDQSAKFKVDINRGYVGFRETWQARPLSRIVRVAVDGTGSEVMFEEKYWIGHVNTSPTRSDLISFCHEGPWHEVDHRIWCMNVDTRKVWRVLPRKDTGIIAGHEYWYADGETIGFHGSRGGRNIIGHIRYDNTQLVTAGFSSNTGHTHSNDANLIVGDGGGVIKLWRWNGTTYEGPRLLCEHKSTMKTQQSHPHPRFNADASQVVFTSDVSGYCNVYLADVAEFESLPVIDGKK